ncbi:unnamed protein product [Brassica napus]|uniref:(rape) hypothetical protein n=1 Tax=Brassica napus TaxID=3708 RepID=A0A816IM06_BRANA|nr:unnamed protein product [Brassica napus]
MEKPPEEKSTAQRPNRFRNRSKPVLQFPVGRITRVPLAAEEVLELVARDNKKSTTIIPRLLLLLPKER